MKRIFLSLVLTLVVGLGAFTVRAGGGHGCGGGGWHGGYGGHGCYGGYYGGHGYYGGGCWPFFSFGIGFGGCYPSYGYYYGYPAYSYPAYGYAYAPVAYAQPAYAYRAAQPYNPSVAVAVAAKPTVRPAATAPVYVYSRAASTLVVQQTYSPAPAKPVVVPAVAQAQVVAASRPTSGTWVLDPNPYHYTPAASGPSGGAATYVATR